jgi:hypothetical protein
VDHHSRTPNSAGRVTSPLCLAHAFGEGLLTSPRSARVSDPAV